MRSAVADAFPRFTATYEGRVGWCYRDVKGLVTTGAGNLIDPIGTAMVLPWQVDGLPASDQQIVEGWEAVKAMPAGLLAARYASATPAIRLTSDAIDELVRVKLAENDDVIRSRFAEWDALPADAQLAVHSLAWACGPYFSFPRLALALDAQDFATCAIECQMDATGNPGLVPRNAANRALFLAAQQSKEEGRDFGPIYGWPCSAPAAR